MGFPTSCASQPFREEVGSLTYNLLFVALLEAISLQLPFLHTLTIESETSEFI